MVHMISYITAGVQCIRSPKVKPRSVESSTEPKFCNDLLKAFRVILGLGIPAQAPGWYCEAGIWVIFFEEPNLRDLYGFIA